MSENTVRKIGRYEIEREIGQGGMAVVYQALDPRLGRSVAIKLIKRDAFAPSYFGMILERFKREAMALARLDHPNIVKILDYGEHEGAPYLVMNYISGTTLRDIRKPIRVETAVKLLRPIVEALDYVHEQGLVHRDIKPSNIMLTRQNHVTLTDFGIAKWIDDDNELATLTGTGVGIGTPEYMAPEQGRGAKLDGRSDLYSLSVIFYELITGVKPFQGATPVDILVRQATEPVPDPRTIVPGISPSIKRFLDRAMAKNPDDRYPTTVDFLRDFDGLRLEAIAQAANSGTNSSGIRTIDRGSSAPSSGSSVQIKQSDVERVRQASAQTPETEPSRKKRTPWIAALVGVTLAAALIFGGLYLRTNQAQKREMALKTEEARLSVMDAPSYEEQLELVKKTFEFEFGLTQTQEALLNPSATPLLPTDTATPTASQTAIRAQDLTATQDAAIATDVKSAPTTIEEIKEVAAGVKPEDLYKAEDDGSFDSISWSMGVSDIATLDPALATDIGSNQIIQLLFMGLTMQNEETGDVMNAIATDMKKGDVAEDGSITYTYTLRSDIPWVRWNAETEEVEPVVDCDGNVRFLTAYDFEYAIKRAADPTTASDYAFMVTDYVKGAATFFAGEEGTSRDDVAVKALDDVTLEITWVAEFAANNMIAGLWTYVAVPSWVIDGDEACDLESAADLWATIEKINTYGPYAAKEWIHDDSFTVIKNPYWPDDVENVPQAQIEEVVFRILNSSAALAEFEAGNLTGVNDIPTSELDRIKADPKLRNSLSIGEDMCTYYYGFNTTARYVDDVRVRRALSMAIDRQSLVGNLTKTGQVPAQWFSRPGLVGAPTLEEYPDLGIRYDPKAAKALIEEYMKDKGIKDPKEITVEIVHNTNQYHANIAIAVRQMWNDTLGINVTVSNQEWTTYLKSIRSKRTPQVYRMGWCSDYMDAANFLKDSIGSGSSANPTVDGLPGSEPRGGLMWYNEEYEKIIAEANGLEDSAKRMKLYADAEQILVYEDAAMAPLYWYVHPQLCSTDVDRTYSILGGKENFYKWSIK